MLLATNATAVASQDFLISNLGPAGASRAIATTPVQLALNAIRRSEIARAIPALPVPNATEAARIFSAISRQVLAVNRATATLTDRTARLATRARAIAIVYRESEEPDATRANRNSSISLRALAARTVRAIPPDRSTTAVTA